MTHAIDPIGAPNGAQAHEQRQPQRYGAEFGAALSHREAVQAALRVNPAAVAERMRETPRAQAGTERQASREARLAAEDEAAEARREEPGQYVDIEV